MVEYQYLLVYQYDDGSGHDKETRTRLYEDATDIASSQDWLDKVPDHKQWFCLTPLDPKGFKKEVDIEYQRQCLEIDKEAIVELKEAINQDRATLRNLKLSVESQQTKLEEKT